MEFTAESYREASLQHLRRAEELVLAMESRCYMGGDLRSKFVVLKSSPRDWLVALAAVVLFVLVVYVIYWPPSHVFVPGL